MICWDEPCECAEDNGHYSALKIETALDAADTQTLHGSQAAKISENLFFSSGGFLAYDTAPEAFMYPVGLKILLGTVVLAVIGPSLSADTFPASGPMVSGKVARLRFGRAAAPKDAPLQSNERFGLQINFARSRTVTAAVTNHSMIAVTIAPALSPTRLAQPA
jgi:hypothetical protein